MADNKSTTEEQHITQEERETAEAANAEHEAAEAVNIEEEQPQTEAGAEAQDASAARIAELERQVEEHQQRALRAQADFDNFRRRTLKEKEELAQYASMKLVTELLPVLDNFERAIDASRGSGDFDALSKGVEMIFRQLGGVLEQEGLKRMETVGQPFNPEFHQAVMQVESDEHEEGTVVEELQKGYMLKDKVIRPAMVKVSG